MNNKWLGVVTATAGLSAALSAFAAPPDRHDVPLTLSGCVVAGEAKDSFLVTNVEIDGSTLAPRRAFYRFNTSDGLKPHVGRRVEVKGKADLDDMDEGTLRVSTEDGKMTTEITSERQTVEVEDMLFGSIGAMKVDTDIPTYKFEVENIKRLNGDCSSAP
jgi:hypothetical protein